MKLPHEKPIRSERIYEGRVVNLRRDEVVFPDGATSTREVVEHHGAVAVIPVDEQGYIYMVRQYRYSLGEELLEIPAGKLEKGEQDSHREAAIRELREETGLTAGNMRHIGIIYPAVGVSTERIHIYLATDLTQGETDPDEDEYLNISRVSVPELRKMILSGELHDAKTICALYYLDNIADIPFSEV